MEDGDRSGWPMTTESRPRTELGLMVGAVTCASRLALCSGWWLDDFGAWNCVSRRSPCGCDGGGRDIASPGCLLVVLPGRPGSWSADAIERWATRVTSYRSWVASSDG